MAKQDDPFPNDASFVRWHLDEGFRVYDAVCRNCDHDTLHAYTDEAHKCNVGCCRVCGVLDWDFTPITERP